MAEPQIFVKCFYCTCKSGPFQKLSKEELQLVDNNRTEIEYEKGEIMCKQGSFISNLMFIKKGIVKIYLENKEGDTVINIVKDGYFVGLQSLFSNNIFHYSAEALSEVQVCLISKDVYEQLIKQNGEFAAGIVNTLNKDAVLSYERLDTMIHKNMNGRFAHLLLFLSNNVYESDSFDTSLSRKELADIASISHESVSRMIKQFKDDGIMEVKGHSFNILDRSKLEQISRVG